jgi:predicted porin
MNKKLIAVAVGGALTAFGAAPALAQNATVNVYGTFYGEMDFISNGAKSGSQADSYKRYDHFQNPGSEIGFRGEEKLGGGMSAWFQCNTSLDYRGTGNQTSTNSQGGSQWCTRNSALGLKGAFGNIFYGNWLTPWTRINNAGNVGSNDTGLWGNAHIISGTSSTFGIASPQQAINTVSPAVYRRRQNNLLTYETPNFSGVTVMGALTTRNHASSATALQFKTRLWSVGVQYDNGPLFVGAAYEKHDDFYDRGPTLATPLAAGIIPGDDQGWTVASAFTFSNNLKLGGSYQQFKSQSSFINTTTGLGGDTKIATWHIGLDWMISGPHGVRLAYSRANNVKGLYTAAAATANNPTGITGTPMNARPEAGPATAADMMQIRYVFQASKRTEFTVGASRTNNRANAIYETGGSNSTQFKGADSHGFGMSVRHSF